MNRFAAAVTASMFLIAGTASAQTPAPDPAKVKIAGDQFDSGVTALKAKDYEGAASRFEAADAAVPSAAALRQAIKARVEAGQGSRAATLSAQALDRYPADDATVKLAKETLEKLAPLLYKVKVSCATACVLASGSRAIPGEAAKQWTVYFDPGEPELSASFSSTKGVARRKLKATAGDVTAVSFEEPKQTPVVAPDPPKPDPAPTPVEADKPGWGLPPAVFIVGLVATAGVGGVMIWSGVDAKTNPGPDEVHKQCAGKTETCQAYQDGLAKQGRTNILIGATAGTAGATLLIGLFLTNWKGKGKATEPSPSKTGTSVSPSKSARRFDVQPSASFGARDAWLGATGSF